MKKNSNSSGFAQFDSRKKQDKNPFIKCCREMLLNIETYQQFRFDFDQFQVWKKNMCSSSENLCSLAPGEGEKIEKKHRPQMTPCDFRDFSRDFSTSFRGVHRSTIPAVNPWVGHPQHLNLSTTRGLDGTRVG